MSLLKVLKISLVLAMSLGNVIAQETHTVTFDNKCGRGTPMLKAGGQTLSTGQPYVSNGPLVSAIAFLQTGGCGDSGEGCILVETTLVNPTVPGGGSFTDLSLIPPHAFNVPAGFGYINGCDGLGADCTTPDCQTAFHHPNDTILPGLCSTNNVNLIITFCD